MNINNIGTVCEDLDEQRRMQFDLMYGSNPQFVDDISRQCLDLKLVAAARAKEIRGALKHNVYITVPISECWDQTATPHRIQMG